ncbi:amino acid ABC transporter permease/ATP-binding protein [Acidihalobacter prosperus]|uniref:Polar amino acid ABC transporter permease n=1 Tax=Acidihalobacter prosperus TaxID=160660 RepID=A0A1A6C6M9_9GAMM|nr:amino acid ABC transporter permease/ATP-binding protein [Acidihalobacter prosperus]OBS10216.1 polar amino acid ABC transporter permease [Acidihalobacter prosperus]
MNYDHLLHYLAMPVLWHGLWLAVVIAVCSFGAALVPGLLVAIARMSNNALLRVLPAPFIWVMRGTPVLLQLLFWYNVLPLLGLRLSALMTAILGLALNEVAFMAEIFRGGLQSVKRTQRDAAAALGLTPFMVMARVVLPQALRAIAPAMGNEAITVLKNTSLASVITVGELTLTSEQVVSTNFEYVEVFTAAGLLYLLATTAISLAQRYFENRLNYERHTTPLGPRSSVPTADAVGTASAAQARLPLSETPHPAARPTPSGQTFVEIRHVRKSFHGNLILRDITLKLDQGEMVFLIGPSGSGKTTLLRTINHLESIDSGEILVDGQHIGYRQTSAGLRPSRSAARDRARVGVGMVFQHFNLFDHMTVLENIVEAPIRVHGIDRATAYREARELLAWAGLSEHEQRYPHQLSGGQQQRIAIIRAVATHPKLILFDEPTSALDPELVNEVLVLMRKLAAAGMTMVIVSHEIVFARDWADRIVFMEDGQIVEQGSPDELFNRPKSARTRAFIELVEGRLGHHAEPTPIEAAP